MRDSMRDLRPLKIALKIENVFADALDLAMLLF